MEESDLKSFIAYIFVRVFTACGISAVLFSIYNLLFGQNNTPWVMFLIIPIISIVCEKKLNEHIMTIEFDDEDNE